MILLLAHAVSGLEEQGGGGRAEGIRSHAAKNNLSCS